jgi:hypothetical protein
MLDEIQSDLSRSVPKESATNFIGDLHSNACHSLLEIGKVSELVKKNRLYISIKIRICHANEFRHKQSTIRLKIDIDLNCRFAKINKIDHNNFDEI